MTSMSQNIYEVFTANVRARMARLGLTQVELAEILGCTQGHVSHVISGRISSPGIDLVDRFARALGTTPDKLLKAPREKIPA